MYVLPSEIQRKIFQYLNRKDLRTCYFVCKSWHSETILLNWDEVTIQDAKIELVKSHLNNYNHSQYFKYGHLIKKLTIKNSLKFIYEIEEREASKKRLTFSKLELLTLLSQLPNLSEIKISNFDYAAKYLSILIDADMKHISEIKIPGFRSDSRRDLPHELYFLVNYKFRNTISKIHLRYLRSTIQLDLQEINILDSLTQFKQLTELHFYNAHDMNLTPSHIQYVCPHLKQLIFASNYSISDNTMLPLLNNSSNIDLNFITSLRSIELSLPSLSTAYTRYLVDYFPERCTTFVLNITEQNAFDWIDVVGMGLVLRLMEKIGRVTVSSIMFETIDNYEVQANTESKMTRYFRLLNAFTENRESRCVAEFGEGYDYHASSFGIMRNEEDIVWTSYQLQGDDFHGPHFGLDLPDRTRSIIGPEMFSTLDLELLSGDDDVVTRALDYALLMCPNLESFHFKCYELQYNDFFSNITYKHEEGLTSSDPKHINTLELEHIRPIQKYLDRLATHLHDIEIVTFVTENWGDLDGNPVLDLTILKKLKHLIYRTTVPYILENENDFVLFKFTNGKEEYYYLDEERNKNALVRYSENPTPPRLTVICDASLSFDIAK